MPSIAWIADNQTFVQIIAGLAIVFGLVLAIEQGEKGRIVWLWALVFYSGLAWFTGVATFSTANRFVELSALSIPIGYLAIWLAGSFSLVLLMLWMFMVLLVTLSYDYAYDGLPDGIRHRLTRDTYEDGSFILSCVAGIIIFAFVLPIGANGSSFLAISIAIGVNNLDYVAIGATVGWWLGMIGSTIAIYEFISKRLRKGSANDGREN